MCYKVEVVKEVYRSFQYKDVKSCKFIMKKFSHSCDIPRDAAPGGLSNISPETAQPDCERVVQIWVRKLTLLLK